MLFIRNEGKNTIYPVVLDGELITKELPKAVMEKFERVNIKPFEEGGSNEE
jgi:pilus assembly protein CpaF